MTTWLVTGGAGFIGGNFVLDAVARGIRVINLDALTYAGNRDTLRSIEGNAHHVFVHGDIGDRALVARLRITSGRSASLPLSLTGVPGSSNARPRDIEYLPPLLQAEPRIDQGFEGSFSHADEENRYALDFAADAGTPVLAARAGTVMQVEAGFGAAGLAYGEFAKRANFIRILHDDGSMALYAHLAADGVLVRQG